MSATAPERLRRRLTTQDASFLYGETASGPMHGSSIGIFEGEIPFEALRLHVYRRLHLIPRYRQRLVFAPFNLAHPTWEDDPDFKIENHIKRHVLPPGSSLEDGLASAVAVNEPPLDRSRPLWEMHSFEGVPDRTLVLSRVHHCMIDGMSGVELSTVVMDFEPEADHPEPPDGPWQPAPLPDPARLLGDAVQDTLQDQLDTLRTEQSVLRRPEALTSRTESLDRVTRSLSRVMFEPVIAAPWNAGVVSQRRGFAWSRFPFADFRAIRTAFGGTVNDVALTIVTEAAARYLAHHGYGTDGQNLRLMCPVSIRRQDESAELGNRVSGMFPTLPAAPMDVVQRHDVVKRETERIKSGREPQDLELLMETVPPIPPTLMMSTLLVGTPFDPLAAMAPFGAPALPPPLRPPQQVGYNFVLSNVPGVQVPQYMAGHRCLDALSLLMLGGTLGYGVVAGTYNQNLYMCLTCEPRLLPDIERMKGFIDAVYEELRERAVEASSPADS